MDTLRSGQIRYPSNHWGAFAEDPHFDIGIKGDDWVALARSAWLETGGTVETFEAAFPEHASPRRHSAPPKF